MLGILASFMDLLIIALCCAAAALALVIYLGRGSRSFLYIALFALVQLLVELMLRGAEIGAPLSLWMNKVFDNTAVVKSIIYAAAAYLLLLLLFDILDFPVKPKHLAVASAVALWLVIFPLAKSKLGVTYFLYLLPYQVYVALLALYGLKRLGRLPAQSYYPLLRKLLLAVLILTALIVVEDGITALRFGMMKDMSPFIEGGSRFKERNYCECLMVLLMLGCAVYVGGRVLIGALSTAPTAALVEVPQDVDLEIERFADALGLSPREREVLPLLLQNKSIVEIAEALFISQGTVKSHTHNIYQKAQVSDRVDLIQRASIFHTES